MSRRCLNSSIKLVMAIMGSSCGMFLYVIVTSALTESVLIKRGRSFSIRLRKYLVSLMCDGEF